jgi:hypothetical protein
MIVKNLLEITVTQLFSFLKTISTIFLLQVSKPLLLLSVFICCNYAVFPYIRTCLEHPSVLVPSALPTRYLLNSTNY